MAPNQYTLYPFTSRLFINSYLLLTVFILISWLVLRIKELIIHYNSLWWRYGGIIIILCSNNWELTSICWTRSQWVRGWEVKQILSAPSIWSSWNTGENICPVLCSIMYSLSLYSTTYRLSFDPFCGKWAWCYGRATSKCLELGIDDLSVFIHSDLQPNLKSSW